MSGQGAINDPRGIAMPEMSLQATPVILQHFATYRVYLGHRSSAYYLSADRRMFKRNQSGMRVDFALK